MVLQLCSPWLVGPSVILIWFEVGQPIVAPLVHWCVSQWVGGSAYMLIHPSLGQFALGQSVLQSFGLSMNLMVKDYLKRTYFLLAGV